MKTKTLVAFVSLLLGLAGTIHAQPKIALGPEENENTPETHELIWETTPEIRYLLEESTTLDSDDWDPVAGFPTEAAARAQAHKFNIGDVSRKFFRVSELDEQAPTIAFRSPTDGSFGIGRFSDLTIDLDDATGIDQSTIQLTVGAHGPCGVSASELSIAAGDVLTFDLGGDTALGLWGEEITVSLTVADTEGNSETYTWTFELEIEPKVASNVFVFGSPDAQRAGQRLSGTAATIASRFYSGPIRMNSGASDWEIDTVADTTVVISYSGATAPSFVVDDLVTNLAPNHLDEIFYRRVTSVSDDTTNKRLTLGTSEATLPQFLLNGSVNLDDAYLLNTDEDGNVIRAIELDETFELPSIGKDFLDGVPEGENLSLWTDGPLELSLAEAKVIFTPNLTVRLETGGLEVQRFEAQASGEIEIACYPVLTVSGAYSPDLDPIELWSYSNVIWTAVGYVPVAVELKASVNATADIDINAAATLTTGFRQNVDMGVAGIYKKDANPVVTWERWFKPEPTVFDPLNYTLTGKANAVLALVPQIDVRVYACAGIYVNTDPRVEIHGSATFSGNKLSEASWLLGAYADVNAGLSVIGFENDELPALPPFRLFTKEWGEEYSSAPQNFLQILRQPIAQSARLGDTVVFSVEASRSAAPLDYTWFQNGTKLFDSGSSITIGDIKATDEGDYQVTISDGVESITSEKVSLDVTTSLNTGPAPSGFVLIPAGEFQMGDAFGTSEFALPVHTVHIDEYYFARKEVTYEQWLEVYNWGLDNGYSFSNQGNGKGLNHPVHAVSWYDVIVWCNAKSEMEGLGPVYRTSEGGIVRYSQGGIAIEYDYNGYRLPTEAEWERAARGGEAGRRFPWGNEISHHFANYNGWGSEEYSRSSGYHPEYNDGSEPFTSPVGDFTSNGYGIYDISGNVAEWCNDFYSDYSPSKQINPRGPMEGNFRVIRGGGWATLALACRNADREGVGEPHTSNHLGFRLARNYDGSFNQTPTAVAKTTSPIATNGYAFATLDARDSFDPDGTIISYDWSLGIFGTRSGELVEFEFPVGTNTVTLKVTDDRGVTATRTLEVKVRAEPRARAGNDHFATDNNADGVHNVILDGSGSSDEENDIISYTWTWGDQVAHGKIVEAGFPPGLTTVTLTVTDRHGITDSDTVNIFVTGLIFVEEGTLSTPVVPLNGSVIETFYIGQTEVSLREWRAVTLWAASNNYQFSNVGYGCGSDHPIHSVSWYDAVKWCNAKSELENLQPVYLLDGSIYREGEPDHTQISQDSNANGFRLPTRAEWEFAARGGILTNGYSYSGSNDPNEVAWYSDNSAGADCNYSSGKGTWPVMTKNPNELGIHDMSGNVWEWCWDQSNNNRGYLGGGWFSVAYPVTVAAWLEPSQAYGNIGFRVIRRE